ncbi:MAG: hypothetical protein WDO74_17000 [Pseudomonadota bacterium]
MSLDRELVLLALGSPREEDAKSALEIVLEAIRSEAEALADLDTSSDSPTSARSLALACRLEALKEFVTEFMTVTWREKQGLRSVQTGGVA